MTEAQAERAARRSLSLVYDPGECAFECSYLAPVGRRPRVSFMMAGGRLARWDVYRRGIATTRGIQVGDSEPKVRRRYPGIHVRRHFYVPRTGHYLTYKPAGQPGRRIRFETDHGRVIYFYGGRLPQVLFIEGCA